jgi:hypothetical protein
MAICAGQSVLGNFADNLGNVKLRVSGAVIMEPDESLHRMTVKTASCLVVKPNRLHTLKPYIPGSTYGRLDITLVVVVTVSFLNIRKGYVCIAAPWNVAHPERHSMKWPAVDGRDIAG